MTLQLLSTAIVFSLSAAYNIMVNDLKITANDIQLMVLEENGRRANNFETKILQW